MKLLYIANLRMPTPKAYGIQIAKNCEAFARAGLEVELVVPSRPTLNQDFYDYYGVDRNFVFKVLPAPNFHLFGPLEKLAVLIKEIISALVLAKYVKKTKPSVVFSRDSYSVFFVSRQKNNFPVILEIHRFSKIKSLLLKFLPSSVFFVATTNYLKEKLSGLGIEGRRILVLPNGVDLKMFEGRVDNELVKRNFGVAGDQKIILYSGGLYQWKGVDSLVKTASLLPPSCRLVILGGEREELLKRFPEEELAKIIFLGHRPFNQVPTFLKTADVFVLPNSRISDESRHFTSPLKMFEYMACRKPVVASRLPSLLEVLDEQTAILVEPDDPRQLADGIKTALAGGEINKAMVQRAYQKVLQYSLDSRARKIIDFIGMIK
jgi:glycosyltransferase involved in cell wall biosynthesis